MLEEIKLMLGDAAAAYTDAQIELALKQAIAEVETYCRRIVDDELLLIAQKITIIKLNRMNTEGLQGQSFSGVNETYLSGYPDDIMMALKAKRKMKLV